MKQRKLNKGISLVALIITIIVLIILTGTVILMVNQGDIIGKSKEAVFKNDITAYREVLVTYEMNRKLKVATNESTDGPANAKTKEQIKAIIPEFKDEYEGVVEIFNGQLVACRDIING